MGGTMNMVALGIDDDGCHEDILNEREEVL